MVAKKPWLRIAHPDDWLSVIISILFIGILRLLLLRLSATSLCLGTPCLLRSPYQIASSLTLYLYPHESRWIGRLPKYLSCYLQVTK